MRKALKKIGKDDRHTFIGTFDGVGFKNTYKDIYQPTIVMTNIKLSNGNKLADHLWFSYTKGFLQLGQLQQGDKLQFDGRINSYEKGYYLDRQTDYKIERPTKIKLLAVDKEDRMPMPLIPDHKNEVIGYVMETNKDFYKRTGRPYETYYVDLYHKWLKDNDLVDDIAEDA